jgi:predicted ribosome quality control (RQC) complex YloA/Tae2 family protein
MSLSDVEIAHVVAELAPLLAGLPVGKVYEAWGHTLLIELGKERLILAAHPRASRLHTTGARGKLDTPGAAPSGFAMLLRKRLGGLRLHQLALPIAGERVVELGFGAGRERLVVELTGPHANVFLVDAAGALVASLRPSRSTTRPLAPGATYEPPPPAPATARWRGGDRFGPPPGTSARVAAHYEHELAREEESALREQLAGVLRKAVDRLERRETALGADLAKAGEAEIYRKYGDLLLAHAWELPGRGATSVTVSDDFEDGSPLTIVLLPTLDGKQNAARYYKQHKRLTGGKKRIHERLAATRAGLEHARARLAELHNRDLAGLRALVATLPPELRPAPGETRRARARRRDEDAAEAAALPYREYRSLAGDVILVGKSASDNDTLSFRVARGNDLWMHTRDAPGAHVVVKRRGKESGATGLAEATMLDAATLAAHNSPLASEAQVDVTYTAAKNLRKPRGAPPGLVYVSDAKTLRVRMDPERLARLLAPPGDLEA